MSTLVINTNPHLKKKDDLLVKIANAAVASFKLEGIHITFHQAYEIAKKSRSSKMANQK